MWSLFLCLLTLNYCDAKLQLASKSSASKNKDWTIWIKKIESQKGIYFRTARDFWSVLRFVGCEGRDFQHKARCFRMEESVEKL